MLTIRQSVAIIAICSLSMLSYGQGTLNTSVKESINPAKPYRILTSGKLITIKSTKDIKNIMVWTSGGHRIVEQKDVNADNYSFRVTVNEKILFVMVQLNDGKVYSEKIGMQ